MKILVTGAKGFIGKNLIVALRAQCSDHEVLAFDVDNTSKELDSGLAEADFVFHLAGVNRPKDESEFQADNADFTTEICRRLLDLKKNTPLVLSSSSQVLLENPYGISKRKAEEAVLDYATRSGARVKVYRLKNVFGKWCRPNYNSVVATFCHNIANNLPITISDPNHEIELIYIDDVVRDFLRCLDSSVPTDSAYCEIEPVYRIGLGRLAALIQSFKQMRETLFLPDFSVDFTRRLYGTFVAYLDTTDFAYSLDIKSDDRGCLAEFIKSPAAGQMFISRTGLGVTRGNHFHHTKTEKFLVVEGAAVIKLRDIRNGDIIEHIVQGKDMRVVDIPPGYTHSIENTGSGELVTLFWTASVFDPSRSDTYPCRV